MKKLNLFGWSVIAAAVAFLAPGCQVDESYDLGNIDTEVTVLPGVEVPLPNFKEVKLKDLIKLESGGVVTEVSGKYVITYAVDPQVIDGFSINANDFKINASSSLDATIPLNQTAIPDKTPLSIPSGLTDSQKATLAGLMGITNVDSFESLKSQTLDFNTAIDFSINSFPTEIKAFKSCTLNGNLVFSLVPVGFPFSKFVLKQGTTITFPAFLVFSGCTNADFDLSAGHILTANKDIDVLVGTGLQFQLPLSGLDMGAGVNTAGTLPLADNITIAGNLYLDPAWFTGPKATQTFGTYEVTYVDGDCPLTGCKITANYTAADITLSTATIKADASAIPSFGTYGFDINGLPSFLTGDDVNIELNEVQLALNLASTLPFPVTLANGQLKALSGTTATHTYNLPNMVFAANTTTGYSIGEHASGGTDTAGNTYVNLPGLGSILSPVPTRVEAAGFNVTIPEDWLTVESGVTYGGTLNVGINAPISFKSTSRVGFVIDADNVSLDLGNNIPLETATLSLTAQNTIPLNFAIEVVAKDENKNPITGVTATVDKPIASGHGTANDPVATPIKITLTLAKGSPAIKGLQLKLNATSDAGASQYPLEPEQGLHLVNVSLGLPDGITMDVKNLGNKNE